MSKFRLRLLPIVLLALSTMLGVRVSDFWSEGGVEAITTAFAQATKAAHPEPPPNSPLTAKLPAAAAAPAPTPPQPTPEQAQVSASDPLMMSPAEIDQLQKLAARRADLDRRAAEMSQQQVVLEAAEKRINDKIAKLQALENSIDSSVKKQDQEDDARAQSLVKIYETMKPAEAARIFEQLDTPVLIAVLAHMREAKAAPILAAMDPGKAKTVTLALAARRNAEQQKNGGAAGSPPANPTP